MSTATTTTGSSLRVDPAVPPTPSSASGNNNSNLTTPANASNNNSTAAKKPFQPWLNAWTDPLANLHAYSPCVRLADVTGDGEYRLLVADADKKLKVFRGTGLVSEHTLAEPPAAMATFYSDQNKPLIPNVAIAAGPNLYIYRNLRPYYKWTLPAIELDPTEVKIWEQLKAQTIDHQVAIQQLRDARDNGINLSTRSTSLLDEHTGDTITASNFIVQHASLPYTQYSVITCMNTLHKNQDAEHAISQLIIGTEHQQVYIMEPSATSILKTITLPSIPVHIHCDGHYDIEYRILVTCRNNTIYTIKKGKLLGTAIEMESAVTGLIIIDKIIYIGCMDHCIHAYNFKGKKIFTLFLQQPILCMEIFQLTKIKNIKLLMFALYNGDVCLYHQRQCLSTLSTQENLTAMRFGNYGREEASLIVVTQAGGLQVKMLQRSANFTIATDENSQNNTTASGAKNDNNNNGANNNNPLIAVSVPEQEIPLKIPKKTKLYVEQTQHEREHGIDMHRLFQRDLCKMRLSTARAYVKIIQEGSGVLSSIGGVQLKIGAKCQGLGPRFVLLIEILNIGPKLLTDLLVMCVADPHKYHLPVSVTRVPMLIPNVQYEYHVQCQSVDPDGAADVIKLFVLHPRSAIPAISAVINMPVSEVDEKV